MVDQLDIPENYWDQVDFNPDPTINQGEDYSQWLPTDPRQQQAGTAGGPIASWGNSPWVPNVSNVPLDGGEYGFIAPNAMNIAGTSPLQDIVGSWLGNIGQPGGAEVMLGDWANAAPYLQNSLNGFQNMANNGLNNYQTLAGRNYSQAYGAAQGALRAGQAAARQTNQGAYIQDDPALQAAQAAWKQTSAPMIQDQFSMMGLGRSGGAGQALANSWTQNATPYIQDAIQREQQDIERKMAGQFQAAQGFQNQQGLIGGQQSIGDNFDQRKLAGMQGMLGASESLMGRGDRINDRQMTLMDSMMNYGNQFRDIAQQANESQYNDYLRRQGLSEQLLMGPMGMLQSSIGTSTNTSGGK